MFLIFFLGGGVHSIDPVESDNITSYCNSPNLSFLKTKAGGEKRANVISVVPAVPECSPFEDLEASDMQLKKKSVFVYENKQRDPQIQSEVQRPPEAWERNKKVTSMPLVLLHIMGWKHGSDT